MTTASDLPDSSSAPPCAGGSDSIVELRDVTKVFPGVTALDGVTLAVRRGEVHGLIGENGAGKSTMMRVLSGLEQPTSGRLLIDGQPVELRHPVDAMRHGVAMIHQELNLVDELSAAENIFLGRERRRGPLIDRRRTAADAAEILDSLGVVISPEAPVRTLSIAQQQLVEVAKALSQKARILIMDEPTAVLTARETTLLFALVDRLRAEGTTIVYISHILSEVRQICDRITVLRDGQVVSTLDASVEELTDHRLASLMVGRPMADHFPPRGHPEPEVVLRIEEVEVPKRVHGVSLEVRRGEVMGLAGLVGAGRTELGEAIAGLRPRSGIVCVQGRSLPAGQPRAAVGSGLCYVSEDRKGRGLSLGLSIASNVTLPSIDRHCRPMLSHRRERRAATAQCDRLQVRRSSVAQADRVAQRRQPAEGLACPLAGAGADRSGARRADAGSGHRREGGDLPRRPVADGTRHDLPDDLLRNERAARNVRPHRGDAGGTARGRARSPGRHR